MLEVKTINQKSGWCGPAALVVVLRYFGVRVTMKKLARETGCTEEKGVEGDVLVKTAKRYGLEGWVKDRAEIADLREWVKLRQVPVIIDWFSVDDGHYSVVVDIGRKYIYIMDPEIGKVRKLPLATFYRVWFDFPNNFMKSEKDLILRRMVVLFDVLPGRGRPGIPSSEAALLPPGRRERRLIPAHGKAGNSSGSRWIKPAKKATKKANEKQ